MVFRAALRRERCENSSELECPLYRLSQAGRLVSFVQHLAALNQTPFDRLIGAADRALRTLAATPAAGRPSPADAVPPRDDALSDTERREAAALMRVNHVGEVCAQALYDAQALAARSPQLRAVFEAAAREETDHLAWTERRIQALGGRTSLLNPLWYGGAFAIGRAAAPALASWPRPNVRSNFTWRGTSTACRKPMRRRGPSSSR